MADLRRLAGVVGTVEPAVSDCAWGRLTPWRELLAALFGGPQPRPALDRACWSRVDSVEPTAGQELVGWFASRLGWELAEVDQAGDELAAAYRTPTGTCQARVVAGIGSSNLTRVHLEMETGEGPASVRVEAPPGHLVATVEAPGQPTGRRKVGRSAGPSTGPAGLGRSCSCSAATGCSRTPWPRRPPWCRSERTGVRGPSPAPPRIAGGGGDPAELAEGGGLGGRGRPEAAVEAHGTATWVPAGGGTLARRLPAAGRPRPARRGRVGPGPVAMGDERCVPVDDPESNWGQAAAALLDHVPVPSQLLRPGRAGRRGGRRAYQAGPGRAAGQPRRAAPPGGRLAGRGEDGHCLSLFPGRPEVEVADRLVVLVHDSPQAAPRPGQPDPGRPGRDRAAAGPGRRPGQGRPVARAWAGDDRLP